ncbi:hypothetical protein M752DRAFT_34069 [Aspergillus phoenicis ATCC 13157]|uniref:Uncharacterized protein n=1 Tax=Aspergillus phoenicis ATCC 13157 TaxID=1353007 RepID=A0A370PED7_ASPPH|nr:hypothetical protein M752DRAFT_34069 [Aspergillus phoenicis ATCC 13157]
MSVRFYHVAVLLLMEADDPMTALRIAGELESKQSCYHHSTLVDYKRKRSVLPTIDPYWVALSNQKRAKGNV